MRFFPLRETLGAAGYDHCMISFGLESTWQVIFLEERGKNLQMLLVIPQYGAEWFKSPLFNSAKPILDWNNTKARNRLPLPFSQDFD